MAIEIKIQTEKATNISKLTDELVYAGIPVMAISKRHNEIAIEVSRALSPEEIVTISSVLGAHINTEDVSISNFACASNVTGTTIGTTWTTYKSVSREVSSGLFRFGWYAYAESPNSNSTALKTRVIINGEVVQELRQTARKNGDTISVFGFTNIEVKDGTATIQLDVAKDGSGTIRVAKAELEICKIVM